MHFKLIAIAYWFSTKGCCRTCDKPFCELIMAHFCDLYMRSAGDENKVIPLAGTKELFYLDAS